MLTPNAIIPKAEDGKLLTCFFMVDDKVLALRMKDGPGLVMPQLELLARHKVLNQVQSLVKELAGIRSAQLSRHRLVPHHSGPYFWRSNVAARTLGEHLKLLGPDEFFSGGQLCSPEYQTALEELLPEWRPRLRCLWAA